MTTKTTDVIDADADEITVDEADAMIEAETQALVIYDERERQTTPANVLPSPAEWEATLAVARQIAGTPFVPAAYRGNPEAVVAAILFGREIGVGPMQALRQINMIDGKPSLSADLMMSQMRRGGVVVIESESTRDRAWIKAKRTDTGEVAEAEWTIEEARSIPKMTDKASWTNYPADMLWARAVGRLARRLGSDLLGGMVYASEEMADWDEGGYGGSPGYAATTTPVATTKDGVEFRADAPRGWGAIHKQLVEIDSTMPWGDWIEQALMHLTGKPKLADLSAEEKRDVGIRVANGVAHLSAANAGRDFPPPSRAEVQAAFSFADSVDATLDGPSKPLDPVEVAQAFVDDPPSDEAA